MTIPNYQKDPDNTKGLLQREIRNSKQNRTDFNESSRNDNTIQT